MRSRPALWLLLALVLGCGGAVPAPGRATAPGAKGRAAERERLHLALGERPEDAATHRALVTLELADGRPGAALALAAEAMARGASLDARTTEAIAALLLERARLRIRRGDAGALEDVGTATRLGAEVSLELQREAAFAALADHLRRRGASGPVAPRPPISRYRAALVDDPRWQALTLSEATTAQLAAVAGWLLEVGARHQALLALNLYQRRGGTDARLLAARAHLGAAADTSELRTLPCEATPSRSAGPTRASDAAPSANAAQARALEDFAARHRQNPVAAERELRAWVDHDVDGLARGGAAASLYLRLGDPVRALRLMERLERSGIRDPGFLLAYAATVSATGDIARAVVHFETAVAAAHDDAAAATIAARWLMWNGAYSEAQSLLRRAIALSLDGAGRRDRLLYAAAVSKLEGREDQAASILRDVGADLEPCRSIDAARAAAFAGATLPLRERLEETGFSRLGGWPADGSDR